MESGLISRVYRPHHQVSTHRVESVPMTRGDILRVYTRFEIGRDTPEDRKRFVHWAGMTAGMFIDKNGIDLVETPL